MSFAYEPVFDQLPASPPSTDASCFELGISPEKLMRSHIDEDHNQSSANYLRWAAGGTLQSCCGHQSLHGVREYIRIRSAMYGSLSYSKHRQHHIRHHDGEYLDDTWK
jgi:hypothetical protein